MPTVLSVNVHHILENITFKSRYVQYFFFFTDCYFSHQNQIDCIFFAAKDGDALYSQQKQDRELSVAQIMNSLFPNSDLN